MTYYDTVVKAQYEELSLYYKHLQLIRTNNHYVVMGPLLFYATFSEYESITAQFNIEITIPADYPQTPPTTKECGGRIPNTFHTNPDGTLCLAAPLAVRMTFQTEQSLLGYVRNLVVPFLYSYSYHKKYGQMPYGELTHGAKGILAFYKSLFKVSSTESVVALLKILTYSRYRGHLLCPCESGLRMRNCHGKMLRQIITIQPKWEFKQDLIQCETLLLKKR